MCFTKYFLCFRKYIDWGRGERKKKLSHLTYAVLPSHNVILLLETLGGSNCTKELNWKAFCWVHHFCNCIMYFFMVLSDKDLKLTYKKCMHCLKCKLFLEHFQWESQYPLSALIWQNYFTAMTKQISNDGWIFIDNWYNLRYIHVGWTFRNSVRSASIYLLKGLYKVAKC